MTNLKPINPRGPWTSALTTACLFLVLVTFAQESPAQNGNTLDFDAPPVDSTQLQSMPDEYSSMVAERIQQLSPTSPPMEYGMPDGTLPEVPYGSMEYANPAVPSNRIQPPWRARGEVLLFFMEPLKTGSLVNSNPAGTAAGSVGLPSEPTTTQVFGGDQGDGMRVGGRLIVDRMINSCSPWYRMSVELMGLGNDDASFDSSGLDADLVLSRPFFNTDVDGMDAQVFQMDGLATGRVQMDTDAEIWSSALAVHRCLSTGDFRSPRHWSQTGWDTQMGFRYLRLGEKFNATEQLNPVGQFAEGTELTLRDRIRTTNDFYGFEWGLTGRAQGARWGLDWTGLCAIGNMRSHVRLNGTTQTFVPDLVNETNAGGFFVPADMVGERSKNRFSVVPQLRINSTYRLADSVRLTAGYNAIFMNKVVRPDSYLSLPVSGSAMGTVSNSVGTSRIPLFLTDTWVHGVSLGLTVDY